MQSVKWSRSKGYIAVGAIGVGLSVLYLALSFQMPMGRVRQPGAGVFPVISGFLLLLGSVSAIWEGFKLRKSEEIELPAGSDLYRLLTVLGGILGYLILLPILGQLVSSTIFCFVLIRALSSLPYWRVILYAIIMAGLAYLLFVRLLMLPMPVGIFGL
ncbi:tripartite tricarboxylate transporter TctB family protein [Zwartia vadi]|uniref:tripartite tricarboxylate transporter TctB family protein n=1 Tax=Zwartia vadi TaxID=3058168 RepID=UPI0025B54E8E|nr:tripartite tricarboxylate transporter TctB family protein [Zwartia vadi]MDN3987742.1 tripartite tricarboxylate transporter TctB family protein [Zwartia vadi]